MRKFIVLSLLFAAIQESWADDYTTFSFVQSDGTTTQLPSNGLKIVYADGNLVATSGSQSATIALSAMNYMAFASSSTNSVSLIKADSSTSVNAEGGTISVTSPQAGNVSVINLAGQVVSRGNVLANQSTVVAQGLKNGVYIIKIGDKSIKTMMK